MMPFSSVPKLVWIVLVYVSTLLIFSLSFNALMYDRVTYEAVTFPVADHIVSGTFALPSPYTGLAMPGVLVFHGSVASKEWMVHLTRALAYSGHAVLAIDQWGHGANTGGSVRTAETNTTISENGRDAVGAIEYLVARPEVNESLLGAVGWSMGGGTVQSLNKAYILGITPHKLTASVIVGARVQCDGNPFDVAFPENLLVLIGRFDELISRSQAIDSMSECVVNETVIPDEFYGGFLDGSARKISFTFSDHIFEAVEPAVIAEAIDWLRLSFTTKVTGINVSLSSIDPINSLNMDFFGSLIAVLWFMFFFIFFEFVREVEDCTLVPADNEKVDTIDAPVEGSMYKWWWWIAHNLWIVAGLGIGYVFDAIVTAPICVNFGGTVLGWAIALPVIFSVSLIGKKGKEYYVEAIKAAFRAKTEVLRAAMKENKVKFGKSLLRSPIGLVLVMIIWIGIIESIMAAVPYYYGLAIPLFKGLDGSGPRRLALFIVAFILLTPGWFFEAEVLSLRVSRDFTPKNVVQVVLARNFFLIIIFLFILVTVFGAQARVLGPLSFFSLIIYPLTFDFAIWSIVTQFGRSRGQSNINMALFLATSSAYFFSQLLPFETC